MTVGLVIVSHSTKIAEGVVDLARQMAPDVTLVAAGGLDDGSIGTSFDKVSAAFEAAESGDGVAVFCDLGSSVLTAETALDFLDDSERDRVTVVDAPVVEGSVAAAVTAQGGATLAAVVAAGETANGTAKVANDEGQSTDGAAPAAQPTAETSEEGTFTIKNRQGLHARPAAELVKLISGVPESTAISVNGVDGRSLLGIMALGVTAGDTVTVKADGPDAKSAVSSIGELISSGFGEA